MPRQQVLRPDPAVVDEIAAMVAEAERPIVIGGRGATWSGAKGALEALAEEVGCAAGDDAARQGPVRRQPVRARHRRHLRHRSRPRAVRRKRSGDRRRRRARPLHDRGRLPLSQRQGGADRHPAARACGRGCAPPICMSRPTPRPPPRRSSTRLKEKGIRRQGWRSNEVAAKIAADRREPGHQTVYPGARHARPAPGGQGARRGGAEGLGHHRRRRPLLQLCDDPSAAAARPASTTSRSISARSAPASRRRSASPRRATTARSC